MTEDEAVNELTRLYQYPDEGMVGYHNALDAYAAAVRRRVLRDLASELRTRFAPELRLQDAWIDGWMEAADYAEGGAQR